MMEEAALPGVITVHADDLRGLRSLDRAQLNSAREPIAARDVAAAKLIATRHTFENLTRLGLSDCVIGDAGAKTIVSSRNLTNLTWLDRFGNRIGRGAARLADRRALPRLAHSRLAGDIPRLTAARLRRRPGVRV